MKRIIASFLMAIMIFNYGAMTVQAEEVSSEALMNAFVDNVFALENKSQFVHLLQLIRYIDRKDIMLESYARSFGKLADGQQDRVESFGITLNVVEAFVTYVMDEEFSFDNLNTYLGLDGQPEDKAAFKGAMDKRKWDFYGRLLEAGADIDGIVNGFQHMDRIFDVLNDLELLKSAGITFPIYTTDREYGDASINDAVFNQLLVLVNGKLQDDIEDTDSLKDALQVFVDYYNWSYDTDRTYTYMYLDYYGFIIIVEPEIPTPTPTPDTGAGGATPTPTPTTTTDEIIDDEGLALAVPTFEDLVGYDWALEAINQLFGYGIINGKSTTVFDPAGKITRAEFAAMLSRMLELTNDQYENPFEDVSSSAWYYDELIAAANEGIITGKGNNLFLPLDNISRQEMATMIGRVLVARGKTYPSQEEVTTLLSDFEDWLEIADWAKQGGALSAQLGIVNGYENLGIKQYNPHKYATRAEAAVMLYRMAAYVETLVVVADTSVDN